MTKKEVKYLVGIFSAITSLMAINIPITVLDAISKDFPNVSGSVIQLLVALPGLLGIASNLIFSKMAHKIYKKQIVLGCMVLFVLGGIFPFFFHDSIWELLLSSMLVGFALGGVQNSSTALICDYFEGNKRAMAMGMLSVFIGLGGTIYTLVASNLGTIHWSYAYLAFLCLIPLIVIQIFCMPKGILEEKPTKTHHVKVPATVIWFCVFGFFMYTCSQLFNSNVSMLVSERGMGSTAESGIVTTVYTVAVMVAGLLIVPFMKVFKKYSLTLIYVLSGIGCFIMMQGTSLVVIGIGAAVMAISYGMYTPLQNSTVSESSEAMGLAFNLALAAGIASLGQASSPVTTSLIAKPFGSNTTVLFGIGLVISALFIVVSLIHSKYNK